MIPQLCIRINSSVYLKKQNKTKQKNLKRKIVSQLGFLQERIVTLQYAISPPQDSMVFQEYINLYTLTLQLF